MAAYVTHELMDLRGRIDLKEKTELKKVALQNLNVRSRPAGSYAEDVINDVYLPNTF